jgi:NAD(P)-dependent dehydrogenase (short-subunit alcohol dehydrogenase family)
MKLKDKVVFITDGTNIFGRTIIGRFKEEGALVAANIFPAHQSGKIPQDQRILSEDKDTGAVFYTCANPESKIEIDSAVKAVWDKFGRIDILIHNNNEINTAGIEDCSDTVFKKELNINVKSAFLYTKALETPRIKAGKGNMVFLSSIHSEKPFGSFTYSLAKGALNMLVRELALEVGPYGIRVNVVSLGPIEGDADNFYSELSPLYEYPAERTVCRKLGTVQDAVEAVLFFADDRCAYANGSELRVDGGFLLTYFSY